jgi:hypothetical protein
MKIQQTRSIDRLKKKSQQKKGSESPEIKNLMEMQKQAFDETTQSAEGSGAFGKASAGLKGLQAAYDLQQEFKEAKTGVQSRYGNIAKALGLANSKQAEMIDKIFGKKLSKDEVQKRKEKFGIKDKEDIARNNKAKKEETAEKIKKRDEMLKEIFNVVMETSKILKSVQLSVEGIANKLRAGQAKETPASKRDMRKLEKKSGLKYSKESGRYRDVDSGKFVSNEAARQRMNLRPTALKTATPASTSTAMGAPPPSASKIDTDLQSKTIGGAEIKEAEPKDPNAGLGKKVDKVQDTLDDIMEIFSIKKFYRLIGGAIGALIPGIVAIGKFLWGVAQKGFAIVTDIASKVWSNIKEFLVGIKLEIPEIMGQFELPNPFGDNFKVGPIGGFTFQPFKFLGGAEKPKSMPEIEQPETDAMTRETQAAAVAGGGNLERPSSAGATGGGGGGGGGSTASAATPTPTSSGGGGGAAPSILAAKPEAAAPATTAPEAAPKPAAGESFTSSEIRTDTRNEGSDQVTVTRSSSTTTTSRAKSNMPGGAAPAPTGKAPPGGKFKNQEEFVNTMTPWAEYASKALGGTPVLGILGQWAGESGSGKSLPAGFNYAGIKAGTKYKKGDYVLTEERYNAAQLERAQKSGESLAAILGPNDTIRKKGNDVTVDQWYGKGSWQKAKDQGLQWVQVKSYFAEFADLKDFADSYVGFLKTKRYADAVAARTPEEFGYKMAAAGYATASPDKYASKVGLFAKNLQGTTGRAADGSMYAAAGGVASGPTSGYPATLHGTEAIIPLDGQSYQSKKAVQAVASAVTPTPSSGAQINAATTEMQATREAAAAVAPAIVASAGGGGAQREQRKPEIQGSPVKAQPRIGDDTFIRAIAKDFSHPSTFTSVSLV